MQQSKWDNLEQLVVYFFQVKIVEAYNGYNFNYKLSCLKNSQESKPLTSHFRDAIALEY